MKPAGRRASHPGGGRVVAVENGSSRRQSNGGNANGASIPERAVHGENGHSELHRAGTWLRLRGAADAAPSSGLVAPDFAALTRREIQVLWLLTQRQTDREIAEVLCLGLRTVESHVASILSKLAVSNRREAAREALRIGLLGATPASEIAVEY
jgi:DNA-binding NarL/FixJ family response regulator